MQAIRLHPAPSGAISYSPSNPAPSSALRLDYDIPVPSLSARGELLVCVKASTVIRDMLSWPEVYSHQYVIPGWDVAGIVTEVYSEESEFRPGDEVFGMANTDRAATWAEYTIMKEDEVTRKPATLTFAQAAALPLSAQTAYEALFEHARIPIPNRKGLVAESGVKVKEQRVLITGAAGAVGVYLVQLASAANVHVVAASRSNVRNEEFLRGLGADEVVEYKMLDDYAGRFDVIIDVVGGEVLAKCWDYVAETGRLITVDSASFNFVKEHEKRGIRKMGVDARFFIVKGSPKALRCIAEMVDARAVRSFVAEILPMARVREAYDHANSRMSARGKVILTF
ncbi:Uncharacterized protein PECH_001673 [Penicillium ucsense]|uniref:Enoyl reductase (ER) domain-containing protein n=1 Tax=Penicillium ucsense TaxID=2839758 RepID=A0A8J8VWJ3_9EURO|nr:Uncharacterized protein PECM_002305 [Penicillium ucsense]KAF7732431.1 Uncharacterized protein PECH_001673 [Penicillium ucsense]